MVIDAMRDAADPSAKGYKLDELVTRRPACSGSAAPASTRSSPASASIEDRGGRAEGSAGA